MASSPIPHRPSPVTRGIYKIPGKETRWKGITFRSRLETKWAVFFDLLGLEWQYEPVDLGTWTPDFLLRGSKRSIYVEVKPITHFERVAKMDTVPGEHLLVGTGPFSRENWCGFTTIGWWHGNDVSMEHADDGTQALLIGIGWKQRGWGIMSDVGSFMDRLSGIHDGDHHVEIPPANDRVLWRDACETVRTVYR